MAKSSSGINQIKINSNGKKELHNKEETNRALIAKRKKKMYKFCCKSDTFVGFGGRPRNST